MNLSSITIVTPSIHPQFTTMPPSRSQHGGGGGRMLPHTHHMDNSTPTISGHGVSAAHAAEIFSSSDQGLTKCICHTHRARICRFINFIYGDIYKLCTCIISPKDCMNPELYYIDKTPGS
jgi:hypothetical protein